jgi:hypothetical protein
MLGAAAAAGTSTGTEGELAGAGDGAGDGAGATLNVVGTGDGDMATARREHGNASAPASCAADIRSEIIEDVSARRPCAIPATALDAHTRSLGSLTMVCACATRIAPAGAVAAAWTGGSVRRTGAKAADTASLPSATRRV